MISKHDRLFPKDAELQSKPQDGVSNNNNDLQKKANMGQLQNKENNNTKDSPGRRCSWDKSESPQRSSMDNGSPTALSGSKTNSPRNSVHKLDVSRSPPLMVKKNPAFNKGSGIVTNGSFSSSNAEGLEKAQTTPNGSLQARRTSSLKGSGTKMGTHSVQNGTVRMGILNTDTLGNPVNGRSMSWLPNGYVTLRDNKQKEQAGESGQHNRLSTYDNVHQQFSVMSLDDKQSIDSATWSTSSCEISLPENSNSCRSSTTTCPEQDFYSGNFEDPVLDGPPQGDLSHPGDYENKSDRRSLGGRSSRATSSSDNSETFVGHTSNHSALHSLVSSLKQEMTKQKIEYESRIKSLEQRNLTLETEMMSLHDELDQERKKFTMIEIKMRNAERAKEDAEKRNDMLQKEMEQFFSTFGELTVEPRRTERGNTIWIQEKSFHSWFNGICGKCLSFTIKTRVGYCHKRIYVISPILLIPFVKAYFRIYQSAAISIHRDSICQSSHTYQPPIPCVSLLLQVKYHRTGEHQNGQSAKSCDEYFTKVNKKRSLNLVPIIAEKSPWYCLV
ncbi:rho GTPase-activating protein 24-like [Pontoporia blainvillei]|uniref:Rho GTPase-activating protein 24-like n=1 Tax=Pontoporia blainvillei TaxID=48723 RepID=A0ABX0S3A2_PONBL|nr:rho GTPase-activating protein 24-like [Pontoporia blainvillei]